MANTYTPLDQITISPMFGHIVIESRMRPEGNRLVGEGRSWHYDGEGRLIEDTGWQPTGCVATWSEDEPRRWWQFWK